MRSLAGSDPTVFFYYILEKRAGVMHALTRRSGDPEPGPEVDRLASRRGVTSRLVRYFTSTGTAMAHHTRARATQAALTGTTLRGKARFVVGRPSIGSAP